MELLLPVIGLILSSLEGCASKAGTCKPPSDPTEFIAEKFLVGSKVQYECEKNYTRIRGTSNIYDCLNFTGGARWENRKNRAEFQCIPISSLSSTGRAKQPEGREGDLSRDGNETSPTDHCSHMLIPNAKVNMSFSIYQQGQELYYRFHHDCHTPPRCGIKCMYCNGETTWINLSGGCTNRLMHLETIRGTLEYLIISMSFGALFALRNTGRRIQQEETNQQK
ncbi:hypothetical protein FKM82_012931 [Ascaphus truei]